MWENSMIELLMKPKKAERKPWEMFFVGLFWASVSVLLVTFVFDRDSVLRAGGGLLVVMFTVISCLPFMYYIIKLEEGKDIEISSSGRLIKEHSRAIYALTWLFLGFLIAFSFWYIVLPFHVGGMVIGEGSGQNFNFQIRTFCAINSPSSYKDCLGQHGTTIDTGNMIGASHLLGIFTNNLYVLIFTILFSLAFGAGAMFILVWNASVIAAAIGIFAKKQLVDLPLGFARYMIHGIPEIVAYFIGALAGGIISVAIIRKDLRGEGTWRILQDALLMIIIAILILIIAAVMEVYLTPLFF